MNVSAAIAKTESIAVFCLLATIMQRALDLASAVAWHPGRRLAAQSINIRFDPDRFSPAAKQARPAFSYFPFGGGECRCLGESFAELEGLLILATLASKVRLRLEDGQTILPDPLMTLRPKVPVHMTIESVGTPERHPATA